MKNSKLIKILSIALAVLLAFSAAFLLFSCKKVSGDDPPPEETDEQLGTWEYTRDPSLEDFATKVTLSSLEGIDSDFDKTGFGRVTVEQHIDGDTVHFWNNSKTEIVKARFIAIDTPESTGKVEPWGKPASIFTKTTLKNAAEIVLQSDVDGTIPLDNNGRYLCWVWYRNEGSDVWRNLNIEILSNGLAMGKGVSSNRYGTVAMDAFTSARNEHINLYSNKKDPLFYYGAAVELTIKALVSNKEAYNGMKVRFEGLVTKSSGNGIYMEEWDEDTQQFYGVYVYGGFETLAPKFLVPGYRLKVTGTPDNNETFGFQVSGLSYSLINPTENDTVIIAKDQPVNPTKIEAKDVDANETLENTFVRLEGLYVKSVYTTHSTTDSDGAMTLTCEAQDGTKVTVRTVRMVLGDGIVEEDYFMGKTINVNGIYVFYNDKPQIKLLTLSDSEIVS